MEKQYAWPRSLQYEGLTTNGMNSGSIQTKKPERFRIYKSVRNDFWWRRMEKMPNIGGWRRLNVPDMTYPIVRYDGGAIQ